MTLTVSKAAAFRADFEKYFAWYVRTAGEEVAWRFHAALDNALERVVEAWRLMHGARDLSKRLLEQSSED